ILIGIGDEQQRAGDLAQAAETYRNALAIAQEQGDLQTLASLYTLLGALAAAQEDWTTAREEYQHALEVYQELDQPMAEAETWTRLGDMHRLAAQPEDAWRAFTAARRLYQNAGDRFNEGVMVQRLGHVQGDRDNWDAALDQYQQAITLFNAADARSAKPEVYRSMEIAVRNAKHKTAEQASIAGDALLDAGQAAEAEAAYREGLELFAEVDDRTLQAQMQNQ